MSPPREPSLESKESDILDFRSIFSSLINVVREGEIPRGDVLDSMEGDGVV